MKEVEIFLHSEETGPGKGGKTMRSVNEKIRIVLGSPGRACQDK